MSKLAKDMAKAFTLLELLVVTTMVVVMLAIMTPAVEDGLRRAETVFCGANEYAAGQALSHWLIDHRRMFPEIYGPGMLMGNLGVVRDFNHDDIGTDERPLNVYLGYAGDDTQVFSAECPSDLGDVYTYDSSALTNVDNVYLAYGSSYREATGRSERWGIKPVFGLINDPVSESLRASQMQRLDNKILLGDWPLLGDSRWDSPMSKWHSDLDRRFNILFGDMHVEFFLFPDEVMDNPATENRPSSTGYYWW